LPPIELREVQPSVGAHVMSRATDGHGSVFRSADGRRWEGCVSLGLDSSSGKRVRKHVRGRTKTEVQRKVDRLIAQENRGAMHLDPRTTLSQWLDTWVEERRNSVRPSTLSGYRTDLLYVARAGTGTVALNQLHERHLDRLFDWVIASGCNRGTLEHLRRTLNPALDAAVARGYLDCNPLPRVALRGARGHVETPYDFDEIARLLLAARKRRNGARWDLAFLGPRQGEVLGLRWTDVDLDRAEVTIRCSLRWAPWMHGCVVDRNGHPVDGESSCGKRARWCPQRRDGGPVFAEVKTSAGNRTLSLPEPLVIRLREHREQQQAEKCAAGTAWTGHDSVFATATGSPIDRTTDREEWLELVDAAGVRRLRIHDLRHTAATALLLLGEDSRTIMAVMGWTAHSLVTRYAHVVPTLRRRVAAKQAMLFTVPPAGVDSMPIEFARAGQRHDAATAASTGGPGVRSSTLRTPRPTPMKKRCG
jgi:integrase